MGKPAGSSTCCTGRRIVSSGATAWRRQLASRTGCLKQHVNDTARAKVSVVGRRMWDGKNGDSGSWVSGRGSLPDAGDGVAQLGTPAEAADRHVEPRSRWGVLSTVGNVRSARSGAQDATSTLSGLGSAMAVSSNVGAFLKKDRGE